MISVQFLVWSWVIADQSIEYCPERQGMAAGDPLGGQPLITIHHSPFTSHLSPFTPLPLQGKRSEINIRR
jgi:hypothetical protein